MHDADIQYTVDCKQAANNNSNNRWRWGPKSSCNPVLQATLDTAYAAGMSLFMVLLDSMDDLDIRSVNLHDTGLTWSMASMVSEYEHYNCKPLCVYASHAMLTLDVTVIIVEVRCGPVRG